MRRLLLVLVALTCSPSAALAAGLQLSIEGGRVSLDAQDVTVRQILAEWARVGKTRIVNAERVTGGPITLKFDAVPEKQALDIILRNVPGYMAAPRETLVADASRYDTIMIMATTAAVPASRPPAAAFGRQGQPANVTRLQTQPPPPAFAPEPVDNDADQADDPAIAAAAAAGLVTVPAPAPGAQPFERQPQSAMPGVATPAPATAPAPPTPSNPWNAPVGTAQPSLAPPPAPQPTQPAQPTFRPRPPQADQ